MDDWIRQIRELGELRDAGLLNEEEFAEQKALVLPSKTSASPGQHCPTCGQLVREARALGEYRRGGQWVCSMHGTAWCKGCVRAERSQRGKFTDHLELGWVCFKHEREDCKKCWMLVGDRQF